MDSREGPSLREGPAAELLAGAPGRPIFPAPQGSVTGAGERMNHDDDLRPERRTFPHLRSAQASYDVARKRWSTPAVKSDAELDSAELFLTYAPFVTKLMLRFGAPRADLDDLVQEVFLIAHRAGGYVPGPAKPSTYLASIAIRLLHTERRKRKVRSFIQADEDQVIHAEGQGDPERRMEQRDELRQVDRVLSKIATGKRAVLIRSDVHGESVVSIAAGLGIKTDTAYSRLRAARLELQRLVDAETSPGS